MRSAGIDKPRFCLSRREDLSIEHFIERIGKRSEECAAWERTLRSLGNLKYAERMRKTKEQMLKSLKRLNSIANK